MITIVCGLPGSGKTLYALWLMREYVNAGRFVASNIRLTSRCPYAGRVALLDGDEPDSAPVFRPPVDKKDRTFDAYWRHVPRGSLIVVDEADNWFDSMDFGHVAPAVRIYHKMHRKVEHDIVYIVQSIENLYNRIRRMCQKCVLCEWDKRSKPIMKYFPKSWSRFHRWEFADVSMHPDTLTGSAAFRYGEAVEMFGWYQTDQIMGSAYDAGVAGVERKGGGGDGTTFGGGVVGGSGVGLGERGRADTSGAEAPVVA